MLFVASPIRTIYVDPDVPLSHSNEYDVIGDPPVFTAIVTSFMSTVICYSNVFS